MVLSRVSASTAAPTPKSSENRSASEAFSGRLGKIGTSGGRAESDSLMELFWKLELMPASLILRTSSS